MHDPQAAIAIMRNFYERSIKITIDHFGIGCSNLSYLQKFHIHALKIDQSFIDNLTADTANKIIVETLIAMAHNLGLKVAVQGVTSQEQLRYLQEKGCDEIQGDYYSKALDSPDFELFAQAHRKGIQFRTNAQELS